MSKKCIFDKKGFCHALACYSDQNCGARDEKGNPKYVVFDSWGKPRYITIEKRK